MLVPAEQADLDAADVAGWRERTRALAEALVDQRGAIGDLRADLARLRALAAERPARRSGRLFGIGAALGGALVVTLWVILLLSEIAV